MTVSVTVGKRAAVQVTERSIDAHLARLGSLVSLGRLGSLCSIGSLGSLCNLGSLFSMRSSYSMRSSCNMRSSLLIAANSFTGVYPYI